MTTNTMPKAEQISFKPAGSITSTDLQSAIEELNGQAAGAVGKYLPVSVSTTPFQSTSFNIVSVDATSGNKVVLTPQTPEEGDLLIVRKTDASTNTVVVSGPGFVIQNQFESVEFYFDGTSWNPTNTRKASDISITDSANLFSGSNVEAALVQVGQYIFRSYSQESYTATAGQTVFNLLNSYTVNTNSLQVFKNGLRQLVGIDYVELSSSQIQFIAPCESGDTILLNVGFVTNTGTTPNISFLDESQTLTAGQTVITLQNAYNIGVNNVSLYLNGVRLIRTNDYVESSSTTLTLNQPAEETDTAYIQIGQLVNGTNPTTSDQIQHTPIGPTPATISVRTALNDAAGMQVRFVQDKAAGDTLASSLPDGATVIVTADESQGGVRVRYTVASAALTAGVVDASGMVRWERNALSKAISTVQDTLDVGAVNVWEFAHLAGGYSIGGDPTTWDWTAANDAACNQAKVVGGDVYYPPSLYLGNFNIPEGVTLIGQSAANLFSADPKGSRLKAFNTSLPIVNINNGSTAIQGAGLRRFCIDAAGAQTGLYIAGASYINIETVSVINAAHTNILIECLASNPTFFVFLRQVTTYNAATYNFRVLENIALGGTFTTAIFCENMISYRQPGSTVHGRVAYIQGQVIAGGYWEDGGSNQIVIDRSISTQGVLIGKGLIIDGASGNVAVKLITSKTWAASTVIPLNEYRTPTTPNGLYYKATTAGTSAGSEPTWPTTIGATVADGSVEWTCSTYPFARINSYLNGLVSVDGNILNSNSGVTYTGPFGEFETDYAIPGITRVTWDVPQIFGTASALRYSWYDGTAKAVRSKTTQPTAASDGSVIVGAEAGFVAAPVSGTWTKGDFVFNAGALRGGVIGWMCVSSGTPGTWESVGAIGSTVPTVTSLPAAGATYRGVLNYVTAGSGTADQLHVCRRKADATYEWVQLTP